ncbi:MAG: hypothetical protein CDV28_14313 [Candidatus Electronema aureum]|uniref:Uncharacterized protein n=1 Tax=Candidatus Electronema aureum TaxID=2005002 RepID=A0A521FZF7_9BACT|nr:MAG: hypothetical protein CDV28_14313 [Candidatus Electronema aureum]
MAELIKCFECGAEVSSEARKCPRCSTHACGYRCRICGKAEETFVLVKYNYKDYGKDSDGYSHVYTANGLAHPECLRKVGEEYSNNCKPFSYTCHLCGYHYDYIPVRDSCRGCGHKIFRMTYPLYIPPHGNIQYLCYRCMLPLIPVNAKNIKLELYNHDDRLFYMLHYKSKHLGDTSIYSVFLHNTCYKNGQKEYDRMNYKEKNDCFLSTALYGEDSSKVRMLCFFRDEYLSASSLGRAFIALYVRLSPPLARAIANKSLLRSLVRYCIVAPALLFTEKFLAYAGRKDKMKR